MSEYLLGIGTLVEVLDIPGNAESSKRIYVNKIAEVVGSYYTMNNIAMVEVKFKGEKSTKCWYQWRVSPVGIRKPDWIL